MRKHWTYSFSLLSVNSPSTNLIQPNTILPLPTAFSITSPFIATPKKLSTPLPCMALWACTDASVLSRPKSGSVAGCSIGLGDSPPSSPESHRQSQRTQQPLSVPPVFYNPTHHLIYPPLSPTRLPSTLSAFCQRIHVVVVRCRFWWWARSVGRAHAHPNQPWRTPTVTPSPIRQQRMRDRSCDFFS